MIVPGFSPGQKSNILLSGCNIFLHLYQRQMLCRCATQPSKVK